MHVIYRFVLAVAVREPKKFSNKYACRCIIYTICVCVCPMYMYTYIYNIWRKNICSVQSLVTVHRLCVCVDTLLWPTLKGNSKFQYAASSSIKQQFGWCVNNPLDGDSNKFIFNTIYIIYSPRMSSHKSC